jgi:hypothetical protein
MHETKVLDIIIRTHTSKVAFNVILSPTNPIVIGLSWFILHNRQMDWHTNNFHFELPQKVTSNCEKPTSKNIISASQNYHLDDSCIKFFKCSKHLGSTQDVKSSKTLFIRAKDFMQATKKGKAFLIYDLLTSNVKSPHHEIPSQY